MSEPSFIPPLEVAREAQKGIDLRNSLPQSRRCCTSVGIRRGSQLANQQRVSLSTIKRMVSYFARHEVDKKGKGWGVDSKGYQAWLLWGGDSGRDWAEQTLAEYKAGDFEANAYTLNGYRENRAPGYQSYAWTTQDWRVVIVKRGGDVDYSDKCGAPSNSLSGGRKRLCLPKSVIQRLMRSKSGKEALVSQARKKEKAPPGRSVRWHPLIKQYHRELEAKTVKDKPKKKR